MALKVKKALLILIGLAVFLVLGVFALDYFIENKLKEQLNKAADTIKIHYEAIEVNTLKGSVNIVKPSIQVFEKTSNRLNAQIEMERFTVDGLSYWDYFFKDEITISKILLDKPKTTYYQNDSVKSESNKDGFLKKLKQLIRIKSLEIQDAYVEVYSVSSDSLLLKTENLNFTVEAIEISPSTENKAISYKDFKVTSSSIFYSLNDYENLVLERLEVGPDFSKFKGITLKTKYSKEALSNLIKVERDHYDLSIDSIEIKNQDFGFVQDTVFYFKSQRVDFYEPIVKIYRDKLVVDDEKRKPMYSEMLRDLNFNLTLNAVFVNHASIEYTEKVKTDTKGGIISFTEFDGEIRNLSNTYKSGDTVTSIHVKSIFMRNTPIDVHWDFDITKPNDEFSFKAEIGKIHADDMNQFMEPNMNLRLKGEVDRTYFTINGNNRNSHIDLKLKYTNFDMVVLKENGKGKNKFLSKIVNIFVSTDSKDAPKDYRHGSKSEVERTVNKSMFNYLWLNVKAGLLSAIAGDGEKG